MHSLTVGGSRHSALQFSLLFGEIRDACTQRLEHRSTKRTLPPSRLPWSLFYVPSRLGRGDSTRRPKNSIAWVLHHDIHWPLQENPNLKHSRWTTLLYISSLFLVRTLWQMFYIFHSPSILNMGYKEARPHLNQFSWMKKKMMPLSNGP